MDRTRVLIGEDHSAVAEQLRGLLEPQFEVVAIVHDGNSLVVAAEALRPDVILADIGMPRRDGISAAQEVLKRDSDARIVFVTVHNEPELASRGLEIGGFGYVLKLNAGDELIPAIHAALRGERYVCTALRGVVGLVH